MKRLFSNFTYFKRIPSACLMMAKFKVVVSDPETGKSSFVEVEESRAKTGLSPIAYAHSLGLLEAKVIAAHCVHIDEYDRRLLADSRVGAIHNPTSNLKLASGVADGVNATCRPAEVAC